MVQQLVAISQEGKDLLYPKLDELILGAIAFFILFGFMYKWVIPRLNQTLEARRQRIQGDLEKAEEARSEADKLLEDYRNQLANAREESNQVVEEARKVAEAMRKEMEQKAQEQARSIVERAQEEIRAERDRVFQELKAQVGELSLQLAERVVGESLDRDRHLRLVDEYIRNLESMPSSAANGNGHGGHDGEAEG
jgi:F-type H+-transporting ATPase subunit b